MYKKEADNDNTVIDFQTSTTTTTTTMSSSRLEFRPARRNYCWLWCFDLLFCCGFLDICPLFARVESSLRHQVNSLMNLFQRPQQLSNSWDDNRFAFWIVALCFFSLALCIAPIVLFSLMSIRIMDSFVKEVQGVIAVIKAEIRWLRRPRTCMHWLIVALWHLFRVFAPYFMHLWERPIRHVVFASSGFTLAAYGQWQVLAYLKYVYAFFVMLISHYNEFKAADATVFLAASMFNHLHSEAVNMEELRHDLNDPHLNDEDDWTQTPIIPASIVTVPSDGENEGESSVSEDSSDA